MKLVFVTGAAILQAGPDETSAHATKASGPAIRPARCIIYFLNIVRPDRLFPRPEAVQVAGINDDRKCERNAVHIEFMHSTKRIWSAGGDGISCRHSGGQPRHTRKYMVYVAFDENDGFYSEQSKVLFQKHLAERIGSIRTVSFYSTYWQSSDIVYYTGHGKGGNEQHRGRPEKIPQVSEFITFMVVHGIRPGRIVFLSCNAYWWLCRNYKEFARLLEFQDKVLLEGSDSKLSMSLITPVVTRQSDKNGAFKGILLSRYVQQEHAGTMATIPMNIENIQRNKEYVQRILKGKDGTPISIVVSKNFITYIEKYSK